MNSRKSGIILRSPFPYNSGRLHSQSAISRTEQAYILIAISRGHARIEAVQCDGAESAGMFGNRGRWGACLVPHH